MVEAFLRLGKVYVRLDQPKSALDAYAKGLGQFPADFLLNIGKARIFEELNDFEKSSTAFKEVR